MSMLMWNGTIFALCMRGLFLESGARTSSPSDSERETFWPDQRPFTGRIRCLCSSFQGELDWECGLHPDVPCTNKQRHMVVKQLFSVSFPPSPSLRSEWCGSGQCSFCLPFIPFIVPLSWYISLTFSGGGMLEGKLYSFQASPFRTSRIYNYTFTAKIHMFNPYSRYHYSMIIVITDARIKTASFTLWREWGP